VCRAPEQPTGAGARETSVDPSNRPPREENIIKIIFSTRTICRTPLRWESGVKQSARYTGGGNAPSHDVGDLWRPLAELFHLVRGGRRGGVTRPPRLRLHTVPTAPEAGDLGATVQAELN
jgi:hypothetical protein